MYCACTPILVGVASTFAFSCFPSKNGPTSFAISLFLSHPIIVLIDIFALVTKN